MDDLRNIHSNSSLERQMLVDQESVKSLLRSAVPDWEWLLGEIESERGWFRFPPFLINAINNLKIENYPLLYEKETAIGMAFLRAFLTNEEIKELDAEFEEASPEQRGEWLNEMSNTFDSELREVKIPKTPAEQEAAKKAFEALSEKERKDATRFGQYFYGSFFPNFFQYLSVMVHGEKLTSLVDQAKAGNDSAFVKAVQIDRRILTVIPHFKERYARAQADLDREFYDKLSYRLRQAPFKGKIRYKSLWLTLAVLDGVGLLDTMTHAELLRLCDDVGVGGYKNRISDEKHLARRLKQYREFQRRGILLEH